MPLLAIATMYLPLDAAPYQSADENPGNDVLLKFPPTLHDNPPSDDKIIAETPPLVPLKVLPLPNAISKGQYANPLPEVENGVDATAVYVDPPSVLYANVFVPFPAAYTSEVGSLNVKLLPPTLAFPCVPNMLMLFATPVTALPSVELPNVYTVPAPANRNFEPSEYHVTPRPLLKNPPDSPSPYQTQPLLL